MKTKLEKTGTVVTQSVLRERQLVAVAAGAGNVPGFLSYVVVLEVTHTVIANTVCMTSCSLVLVVSPLCP